MQYKGHKAYINYLGKYVAIFEEIIKNQITSDNAIKRQFPDSYKIYNAKIKKHVGHATIRKINTVLHRNGITLAYNGSNCLIYELCRHIRNSFCHQLLEVSGDKLYVYDKHNRNFSSNKTLIEFIKSIVKEYENQYQ